jgi:hypothetical protein
MSWITTNREVPMMIGTKERIHRLSGHWATESVAAEVGARDRRIAAVPTRRREPRTNERKICTYELCESIDEESVVIQQGEVFSLNRSEHGIQVLMGQAPHPQQLMELHIPESRWRHSVNLYEVQWTNAVQVESQGELYLVGCRLTFGPSHYWTF